MTASDELLTHYQKWFEVTLFENRMIQERKWHELQTYSQQKEELMRAIRDIESKDAKWGESQSEDLRLLIRQLADLEQLNHSLLRERMAELKVQIDDSTRRVRMMRQIGRRYQERSGKSGPQISHSA